jgi:hypothetical protein
MRITTLAEWEFIQFARALLRGQPLPVGLEWVDTRRTTVTAEGRYVLLDAASDLIRSTALDFLFRHGGYQRIEGIVHGRRRTGRLWEEGIWNSQTLAFSTAGLWLLEAVHNQMVRPRENYLQSRLAALAPRGNGDVLFLHVVLTHLLPARWPQEQPAAWAALLSLSPLTQLIHFPYCSDAALDVSRLVADDWSLYLSYLTDEIVRRWLALEQRKDSWEAAEVERVNALQAGLFLHLLDLIEGAGRYHLLKLFVRFFAGLLAAESVPEWFLERVRRQAAAWPSMSQRERFEASFGELFAVALRLGEIARQLRGQPRVEQTDEMRLFLQEMATRLDPRREDVRQLYAALRREVG